MTDSRKQFEQWAEARHWQEDAMKPEWCGALKGLYEIWSGGWSARDSEVERLREALTKIAAIEDQMYGHDWDEIEQARVIARAALSSQVKEPGNV